MICFNQDGKHLKSFANAGSQLAHTQSEINSLCYHQGAVWFNTGTYGFCKLDIKTGKVSTYELRNIAASNIKSIFPYSNNKLWIGGDNGLYEFDIQAEKLKRLDNPNDSRSLSDPSVCHISADREKGMWICTYLGGINYLADNRKPFEHYYPEKPLRCSFGKGYKSVLRGRKRQFMDRLGRWRTALHEYANQRICEL